MKDRAISFLLFLAERFLRFAGQAVWDGFWEVLFEAVEYAERQFDNGQRKKEKAMEYIMNFITEKTDFNFIKKKAIEIVASRLIDSFISQINEELGNDWVDQFEEWQEQLAERYDFIM